MTLKTLDRPKIRPANSEDVIAINGSPYDHSFKGFTVVIEGKPIAITGVMLCNPITAFLNIADGVDPKLYKRIAVILIRKLTALIKTIDAPVYAIADTRHPTAYNLLKHIGFKEHSKGVFIWQVRH